MLKQLNIVEICNLYEKVISPRELDLIYFNKRDRLDEILEQQSLGKSYRKNNGDRLVKKQVYNPTYEQLAFITGFVFSGKNISFEENINFEIVIKNVEDIKRMLYLKKVYLNADIYDEDIIKFHKRIIASLSSLTSKLDIKILPYLLNKIILDDKSKLIDDLTQLNKAFCLR